MNKWLLALSFVVSVSFISCKESAQTSGEGPGGPTDQDGDGVADIDDVFPDNPLLGSLSVSLPTGQQLLTRAEAKLEAKAVVANNKLAIGWCDNPVPTMMKPNGVEFPLIYPDQEAVKTRCSANANNPDCGHTVVFLKDTVFSDGRIDVNVESDPKLGWTIYFRANDDLTQGYGFSYSPGAHRWAAWPGGEWFPYGMITLSSLNSMTLPNPPDGPGGKRGTMIAGLTPKNSLSESLHHLVIEAFGSKITVYDNDKFLFTTEDNDWRSGKIGFETFQGSCVKILNASVADKLAPASATP